MAMGQRLEMRQGQSLVMTPQLQQAIKLLQLSNVELADYCEQELEKNPLLERDDGPAAEIDRDAPAAEAPDEPLETALAREDFSKCEDMDASRDDLYDSGEVTVVAAAVESQPLADWTTVKSGPAYEGQEDLLESTLSETVTLKDHLQNQLAIAALNEEIRLILVSLIDAVDEAGYLRIELPEVAARLGLPLPEV